jgi:hypothetical protein
MTIGTEAATSYGDSALNSQSGDATIECTFTEIGRIKVNDGNSMNQHTDETLVMETASTRIAA